MSIDHNFFSYFLHASLIVQCVMIILFGASVLSWAYILQNSIYLRDFNREISSFEALFWHEKNLSQVYADSIKNQQVVCGLQAIFCAGFREFMRLSNKSGINVNEILLNAQRAMHVVAAEEQEDLEARLPVLATIGSITPYIGLFGTVWGIMTSFQALAQVQQATIAMVAPGIAEALIATAMGLFAAIPAAIAYNRYATMVNKLLNRFDAFQESLLNILFYLHQQAAESVSENDNSEMLI